MGGGNGRAVAMARMINKASVTKSTWHKQEGEEEKKEREGRGEGEDGRTRKFQNNINSKAIDCNKDNSNRSNKNDQSDGQKQQQQQSKDGGKIASWTDVYEYWNWPPSRDTPMRRKRTTFLKMKQVSSLSLQPRTIHARQRSCLLQWVLVAAGLSYCTTHVGHLATPSSTVTLMSRNV